MGFDTTGITGYVGDDTFNKIFQSKQLQDNAEYRNALLKGQRLEQDALLAQKQAELKHKKMSEAADRALKSRELDIKEKQIGNKDTNIGNLQAVNSQLKRFEESFKNMPNKLESNTLGRLRAATGFQTENEANFNSQRQLLFNKIARDLGGEKGVLSDQDIKRIEGALPSYTDSTAQKQAKMQAIYDLLNDRLAVEGGSLNETTTNEGWAF
jgi:poly-D-alanine transfer protein DltD